MMCLFRRHSRFLLVLALLLTVLPVVTPARAGEKSDEAVGYASHVFPFFQQYCIRCHGPDSGKGGLTLHAIEGDLTNGRNVEQWEAILNMLNRGEMPPEEERQPREGERKVVTVWIESGLREYVRADREIPDAPAARRLTNVEYQNTMRDLLGFELKLSDRLPKDPFKPYRFNNTGE